MASNRAIIGSTYMVQVVSAATPRAEKSRTTQAAEDHKAMQYA